MYSLPSVFKGVRNNMQIAIIYEYMTPAPKRLKIVSFNSPNTKYALICINANLETIVALELKSFTVFFTSALGCAANQHQEK